MLILHSSKVNFKLVSLLETTIPYYRKGMDFILRPLETKKVQYSNDLLNSLAKFSQNGDNVHQSTKHTHAQSS
jgi:hypothetical protein